jgi:acid phosphatase type 7
VILTGHDHIYERFAPQTPTGAADPLNGIRSFVVGTGGSNHTTIPSVASNSEVRNADTFGILRLTLRPNSYDWRFVPEPGKTFTDSGSASCH